MVERSRRQFLGEIGAAALAASGAALAGASAGSAAPLSRSGEEPARGGGPQLRLDVSSVTGDTDGLVSYFPIPSLGLVPVYAYLIHSSEPVLVDTGLAGTREAFMENLRSMIAMEDLRWLWLTHTDPDHTGALKQVLAEAPNVRVVTTFLGMGKMMLYQFPVDRVYLLNPGQSLDVGDRQLTAVKPPVFDAPETTGLFDTKTKTLFSADCFGALMQKPAESVSEIDPDDYRAGAVKWATVDTPWLHVVDGKKFKASFDSIRNLEPKVILSSHLPRATGMTETLIGNLVSACSATPFVGPDQTALERMMSEQPKK
jgi:glyoxylase-like metal-dependent hydrolase (beta-lactamase superfamily II)